jgi:class 3 adenylate cyclase
MERPAKFEFSRSRGVVWVCDVAGSSSRLNNENGVEDTEMFLPRLYWAAALVVESAGGRFIKWTGDGFLAWFETPLHRDLRGIVCRCLEAVWHLTVIVNVTQLGAAPKDRFHIRHGLTYEHDALLTKVIHVGGFESLDLIGRAVVLAFRLSGIRAAFPGVTAQREIVEVAGDRQLGFKRWIPTTEEKLKYFKGEKWGTDALYVSGVKKPRTATGKTAVKQARVAVQNATADISIDDPQRLFCEALLKGLMAGPEWSRNVAVDYTEFIKKELLGSLQMFLQAVENSPGWANGDRPGGKTKRNPITTPDDPEDPSDGKNQGKKQERRK